jgi:enoyl-CoA hydratase
MAYETLLVEQRGEVLLITLNRPEALNALNRKLMDEMTAVLDKSEVDDSVGVVVITGSAKAFAAGADIKDMQSRSYMDVYKEDFITANWERVTRCR